MIFCIPQPNPILTKMPQDLHSLLCTEGPNMFFDDLDGNACCDWIWGFCYSWQNQKDHLSTQGPVSDNSGSNFLMGFRLLSEERVKEMIETEKEYFPNNGYTSRLRTEELMLSVRSEAVDWILKDKVVKCVELIEDLSLSSDQCGATTPTSYNLQRPRLVLDGGACLSYKSDGVTVGSSAKSS